MLAMIENKNWPIRDVKGNMIKCNISKDYMRKVYYLTRVPRDYQARNNELSSG